MADSPSRRGPKIAVSCAIIGFLLLRVPSLLEPLWYSDESTYAYVGKTVLHGGVLYASSGAWDNKPPLQYWTYGILVSLFGPSESAIHAFSILTGLLALCAVYWGMRRLTASTAALVCALVIAVILLGTPIFDADLLLPENIILAPLAWAEVLFLVYVSDGDKRESRKWWPAAIGILLGIALGYQQTAFADVIGLSIAAILLRRHISALASIWVAGVLTVLAWFLPVLVTAGWSKSMFAMVFFYLAYVHNSLPHSESARMLHLSLLLLAFLLVIAGAFVASRSFRGKWWIAAVLAGCELLVPASASYPYPHLLLPAFVPCVLAVTLPPWGRLRALARRQWLAVVPLAAGVLLCANLASVAGTDWLGGGRSVLAYYAGGYEGIVNTRERISWQDGFNYLIPSTNEMTAWLDAHRLDSTTAVVWAESDEWLYLTANLHATIPTVGLYNDNLLIGNWRKVGPYVGRHHPRLIVVELDTLAINNSIIPVLNRSYHPVHQCSYDEAYVENARAQGST